MADQLLQKIDSNQTGLRFCEEVSIGVLPPAADQVWYPMEPNSYSNWGGQTKLTQRSPITDTRQKRKGVLTDLDAAGSANVDMTLTNYQRLMQGFMFADAREPFDTQSISNALNNGPVTAVASTSTFDIANGALISGLKAKMLLLASGFTNAANNGLFHVASTTSVDATGVLTSSANYADGNTVTIGTRVYTFQTVLTEEDGNVLVGASEAASITNLTNAINGGIAGNPGVDYFVDLPDPEVSAVGASHTVTVSALHSGSGEDAVPTTTTSAAAWTNTTLVTGSATIVISEATLVNEASPPAAARLEAVGVQFASGDVTIANTGSDYPSLLSTVFDFTTLPLVPGCFVYIGGDFAASAFNTDTDNGFCRVRSIATHTIVLDKTTGEMVTDAGTAKTIQIFFGKVIKNEANHDGVNNSIPIKRRTYQMERTLGNPSEQHPTETQAEYLVGTVPDKFKMTLKTADKVTSDLDFVALTTDFRTFDVGPKSEDVDAVAPTLISEDAFNTTSHVARIRLAALSTTDANPQALIGFVSDMDFTIDNMLKANKAIGVLGAFEVTAGHFDVQGTLKAYFSTVEAQTEVKENGDITLDISFVEANKGITVDMPLIALSDGRPDVVSDEPIMLPLNMSLAPDNFFNHELLWVFYDYLPDVAQPVV